MSTTVSSPPSGDSTPPQFETKRGVGLLVLSAAVGLAVLTWQILQGAGRYPDDMFLFEIFAFWAAILVLLVCLVRAIHGRRFGAWRFVPLLFLAASLAIARWGNLEGMATRWNFDAHMQARLEVIEMVSKAELPAESKGPCDCFYARLPPRLAYLSSAGIVSIARYNQEFSVTFYVRRVGMFPDDDYTAFIYRSGAGVPETGVEDTDHFMAVDRWAPHWFFVVHT